MMKASTVAVPYQPIFQISSKNGALVNCLDLAMKINNCHPSASPEEEGCFESVSSTLPPLDQVTTCSEDCSDDVSSVSSGSIGDDLDVSSSINKPSSPRSIFKDYWGCQGQSHKLHRPLPIEISARINKLLTEDETPVENIYEETLRDREENAEPGIAPKRRSIFNNRYQSKSAPTLHTSTKYFDLRKIQSSHALGQNVPPSCLRPCRYSGPSSTRRTSESSGPDNSVRFSEKIQITVFQPSLERYAEEGWSDFFAYR